MRRRVAPGTVHGSARASPASRSTEWHSVRGVRVSDKRAHGAAVSMRQLDDGMADRVAGARYDVERR